MAKTWRTFKTLLTRRYVFRYEHAPWLLRHPPNKYRKHIDQPTWEEFVKERLTERFKKEKLSPSKLEDRAIMWVKGRETKDGELADDDTKDVANKMVNDGSLVIEGSSDVLSLALGTPEHSGRVRGVGFGVTPTTYFHLPRRGTKKYIKDLETKLRDVRRE
ncbi:hypothetical protein LguiA_001511 [Lonicera macranthoides]